MALESIALIPSGYKANKLYCQLPVDGGADLTTSRASGATRVNKNGLIEDVATGIPRLDYTNGGCPELLLEPQSTNLCDVSKVDAYGVSGTITRNTLVSLTPTGVVESVRLIKGSVSNEYCNLKVASTTLSATTDYTHSIFVKRDTADFTFRLEHNTSTNYGLNWNVSFTITESGVTINSESNATGSVVDYGNGWYRVSATLTTGTPSTAITSCLFRLDDTNGIGASVLLQYHQFEQQSYATSYIPTSGATATRNAETCNGAGSTDEINSQEGVLFFEGRALADSLTFRAISLSDGSSSDRVFMYYSTTSNRLTFSVDVSSSNEFFLTQDFIDITQQTKIAFQYKQNDFKVYVNGLLIGVGLSGNVPSSGVLTELAFDDGSGSPFYGRVKKLSVYNDTTQDLEQLTGFTSFAEMSSYLSYS